MSVAPQFWVVVPAAGSARRMGTAIPKQYLPLLGRTVLEHSLQPFLARAECQGIIVVLAANDLRWPELACARDSRIATVVGGNERADSVRAGLAALESTVQASDWILVHDAARPCLARQELDSLLLELAADEVGGLLAAPVVDTLKRGDASGRVCETVDRSSLWHALTPQMFRFGTLARALDAAKAGGAASTDEAQAVEALGLKPKLVAGSADNLKITMPTDLSRAERILAARGVS